MRGTLRLLASEAPLSFVERVKIGGANALLGAFSHRGGHDKALDGLVVTRVGSGEVTMSMRVEPQHANAFNTLHGGCQSLIVDVAGTMALLSTDPTRPGVSVELNTSFLRPAKVGETISIIGRVLKTGKRIGYTEVSIYNAAGELCATGRHIKAFN